MRERRMYIRYPVNLHVKYIYTKGVIVLEGETYAQDISLKGMRLHLCPEIEEGDRFMIEMSLPFVGTVSVLAKVIWTKTVRENKEAGVVFDWISDIDELASYIEDLQLKAA